MVAANATSGAQHSVKLDAVHELGVFLGGNDCAVESIRFDFLVPTDAEFEVGPVEGRLCEWSNLLGTAWPNRPDCGGDGEYIEVQRQRLEERDADCMKRIRCRWR